MFERPGADVAQSVADALMRRGETVAVAESSAGGLVSAALVSRVGASAWFVGGVIPYGASVRRQWLGVDAIDGGAVSASMAGALAEAARERTGATWGVGETGIAGPQHGRRSLKPAGLGYVAVSGPSGTAVEVVETGMDSRVENQEAFAYAALSLLARRLSQAHVAGTPVGNNAPHRLNPTSPPQHARWGRNTHPTCDADPPAGEERACGARMKPEAGPHGDQP